MMMIHFDGCVLFEGARRIIRVNSCRGFWWVNGGAPGCPQQEMSLFVGLLVSVVALSLVGRSRASLNFYIDESEVKMLLGIPAELYYVRDGVVNEYATRFMIVIPSDVNQVHFTWENSHDEPMPYTLGTTISNPHILSAPELNISKEGLIPSQRQVFHILLQCTGTATAHVDLSLVLNVTLDPTGSKVTSLVLPRRKICLGADILQPSGPVPEGHSNLFYIAVVCGSIAVVAILTAAIVMYTRSEKAEQPHRSNAPTPSSIPVYLPPDSEEPKPLLEAPRADSSDTDAASELQARMAEVLVLRERVTLSEAMLQGTFGRVYYGMLDDQKVLVKTVTENASPVQLSLLLQEGLRLFGLSHRNLLTVVAVVAEGSGPPLLLFPLPSQGAYNLKKWLMSCHPPPEGMGRGVSTQEVVSMALQVLSGLLCLHRSGLLHRDVSSRNCVVDHNLRVKLADNALSRDLFPADYHCLGDNENRPVKWLALESLAHRRFSTASDVWMFGVLLWELATLAQQPYMEVDPFEMATHLRQGNRLVQPFNCPDQLFSLMMYCWTASPEDRPRLGQLEFSLRELSHQLDKFV